MEMPVSDLLRGPGPGKGFLRVQEPDFFRVWNIARASRLRLLWGPRTQTLAVGGLRHRPPAQTHPTPRSGLMEGRERRLSLLD